MADLSGLKKRVELIDIRLRTAHSTRERESAALTELWEQIRERFLDQNAEITNLRERISDLEDARNELLQMLHGLLSAVEGGLERMSDETVPQIKVMAANLLNADQELQATPPGRGAPPSAGLDGLELKHESSDEDLEEPNFHSNLLDAIQQSIEHAYQSPLRAEKGKHGGEDISPKPTAGGPASPGIRDLVARIEGAVGRDVVEISPGPEDDVDPDDELTRDLREIEALRGELHGLRERISSGGR